MSRTYKKRPHHFHRKPCGHKQAKSSYEANGGRSGGIPPSAREDLVHGDQSWIADKIAFRLHQKGLTDEQIIRHISRKYNLTYHRVKDRVLPSPDSWWRNCNCHQCEDRRKAQRRKWLGKI